MPRPTSFTKLLTLLVTALFTLVIGVGTAHAEEQVIDAPGLKTERVFIERGVVEHPVVVTPAAQAVVVDTQMVLEQLVMTYGDELEWGAPPSLGEEKSPLFIGSGRTWVSCDDVRLRSEWHGLNRGDAYNDEFEYCFTTLMQGQAVTLRLTRGPVEVYNSQPHRTEFSTDIPFRYHLAEPYLAAVHVLQRSSRDANSTLDTWAIDELERVEGRLQAQLATDRVADASPAPLTILLLRAVPACAPRNHRGAFSNIDLEHRFHASERDAAVALGTLGELSSAFAKAIAYPQNIDNYPVGELDELLTGLSILPTLVATVQGTSIDGTQPLVELEVTIDDIFDASVLLMAEREELVPTLQPITALLAGLGRNLDRTHDDQADMWWNHVDAQLELFDHNRKTGPHISQQSNEFIGLLAMDPYWNPNTTPDELYEHAKNADDWLGQAAARTKTPAEEAAVLNMAANSLLLAGRKVGDAFPMDLNEQLDGNPLKVRKELIARAQDRAAEARDAVQGDWDSLDPELQDQLALSYGSAIYELVLNGDLDPNPTYIGLVRLSLATSKPQTRVYWTMRIVEEQMRQQLAADDDNVDYDADFRDLVDAASEHRSGVLMMCHSIDNGDWPRTRETTVYAQRARLGCED